METGYIIISIIIVFAAIFSLIYYIYKINEITNDYIYVNKFSNKEVYVRYGCQIYEDGKWVEGIIFQDISSNNWLVMNKEEFINCYTKKYGRQS